MSFSLVSIHKDHHFSNIRCILYANNVFDEIKTLLQLLNSAPIYISISIVITGRATEHSCRYCCIAIAVLLAVGTVLSYNALLTVGKMLGYNV